jgi:hypothetical protein
MAKITQGVELTDEPADSDVFPIVDVSISTDSLKRKKIAYSTLVDSILKEGRGYSVAGSHKAYFPYRAAINVNPLIMLGDSNTIVWMYLNAAPPGWAVFAVGQDTVLGVAGGSKSFNVEGGNPDSDASWVITGLGHTHNGTTSNFTLTPIGVNTRGDGNEEIDHTHTFTTSSNSGSDGTWRPKASIGRMFKLDASVS